MEIENLWTSHQKDNWDARVNSDVAWNTFRRYLQEEKKRWWMRRANWNPREELQKIRIIVGENPTSVNMEELRRIHELKRANTIKARRKSRVRWL